MRHHKSDNRDLAVFLIGLIVVLGGLPFATGALYIDKHEGDTIHMADIVLRMAAGQLPHLDFMTPIGVLAVAPIALFVRLGLGIGHAFFAAQLLMALIVLPAVLWVAASRIGARSPRWVAWVYAAYVIILCLALVHGEADSTVSISMHYNRWAWAWAYLVLPLVMLETCVRPRPAVDGLIIGLGLAFFALSKLTFFLAFAPTVLIALFVRRQWCAAGVAVTAGLVIALIVTLLCGMSFLPAYAHDLLLVSQSTLRQRPGELLAGVIAAPSYFGETLTILASIILLRLSGRQTEGLLLLLLMPGFIYVTYQNSGNDPQWLVMLTVFALVLRPAEGVVSGRGWDLRQALTLAAVLSLTFGFPSALNLTYSPLRNLLVDTAKRLPLLPEQTGHHDILAVDTHLYLPARLVGYDRVAALAGKAQVELAKDEGQSMQPTPWRGEMLASCEVQSGAVSYFEEILRDLEANGYSGSGLIGADLFSSAFWLYGDFRPVKGAAPWYYGGLPGVDDADYVIVPLCPMSDTYRRVFLDNLAHSDYVLTEVRRTASYILYKPTKAGG